MILIHEWYHTWRLIMLIYVMVAYAHDILCNDYYFDLIHLRYLVDG